MQPTSQTHPRKGFLEELWEQASHHACSPPACETQSANASSALPEPSPKRQRAKAQVLCSSQPAPPHTPRAAGNQKCSFGGVGAEAQLVSFPQRRPQDGSGGRSPLQRGGASSAGARVVLITPTSALREEASGSWKALFEQFVCSVSSQQPPRQKQNKGQRAAPAAEQGSRRMSTSRGAARLPTARHCWCTHELTRQAASPVGEPHPHPPKWSRASPRHSAGITGAGAGRLWAQGGWAGARPRLVQGKDAARCLVLNLGGWHPAAHWSRHLGAWWRPPAPWEAQCSCKAKARWPHSFPTPLSRCACAASPRNVPNKPKASLGQPVQEDGSPATSPGSSSRGQAVSVCHSP